MFSYSQSAFFVGRIHGGFDVLSWRLLNRLWPISSRKLVEMMFTGMATGDFGDYVWCDSWGSCCFTVWTDFREAEVNANLEASSLMTVCHGLGRGLPSSGAGDDPRPGDQVCGVDDQRGTGRRLQVQTGQQCESVGWREICGRCWRR